MILEIQNLTKKFGSQPVVHDVSLNVYHGQHLIILGPSGCGKSTLLKLIAGLISPSHGKILFKGTDITRLKTHDRHIPLVFQDHLLFPHMNVSENIAFGLGASKIKKKGHLNQVDSNREVRQMLQRVQLSEFEKRYPSQLSGGQRQRVALARAMILRPQLILMDEPLSHLDSHLRMEMRHLILDLCATYNTTLVMVTHDPQEALSMGSMIGVMSHGRMWEVDQCTQIFSHPTWDVSARLMGFENIFDDPHTPSESVLIRHEEIESTSQSSRQTAKSCRSQLMLRPESIEIKKLNKDDAVFAEAHDDIQSRRGQLIRLDFEGNTVRAVFSTKSGPIVWRGAAIGPIYALLMESWQKRQMPGTPQDEWNLSWSAGAIKRVSVAETSPQSENERI